MALANIDLLLLLILFGGFSIAAILFAAAKRLDQPALVLWSKGVVFLTFESFPAIAAWNLWTAISRHFASAVILQACIAVFLSGVFAWIGWIVVKPDGPKANK